MTESLENFENTTALILEPWILNMKKVSLSARMLYSLLESLSRKHGFAWPSQRYLAGRLGISQRTISALIGELKKAGIIKVDAPTTTRSTCAYIPKRLAPARSRGIRGVRKGGTQNLRTTGNTENSVRENTPLNPPKGERAGRSSLVDFRLDEFNHCFQAWPLQQNRKGALRAWKRLARQNELPLPGKVCATIENFKNRDSSWKRSVFPSFSRWLRNHRWNDQPNIATTYPPRQSVPSGPQSALEAQARGQLALVRVGIETNTPYNSVDETTQRILMGYGGFNGLRLLPRRDIGFVLSGFVKEYFGLKTNNSQYTNSSELVKTISQTPLSHQSKKENSHTYSAALAASNYLCVRYIDSSRSTIFSTCLALAQSNSLPPLDDLKEALPVGSLSEPVPTWLNRTFGGHNA